jgi:hypothetical protein
MARPSTIDRLDPAIRDGIGRLREQGRTIDEILAHLQLLEVDVSRSALGRHIQKIDEIGEHMRQSRAVAEALVANFGEQPDNRLARLNIEMMHGVVMKLISSAVQEGGVALDPEQVLFVSRSLQSLAGAAKADDTRILLMRKEFAKETKKAVDKVVDDMVTKIEAMTGAEVLRKVREDIYGIFDQ